MNASVVKPVPPERREVSSCQELHLEVENRLRQCGYYVLRDVSCQSQDGILYLTGSLPSYYLKQMAQAIANEVEGVRLVENGIQVISPARIAPVGRDRAPTHRDGVN